MPFILSGHFPMISTENVLLLQHAGQRVQQVQYLSQRAEESVAHAGTQNCQSYERSIQHRTGRRRYDVNHPRQRLKSHSEGLEEGFNGVHETDARLRK